MGSLFDSTGIINHLEDHGDLHKQVVKMLGDRIRKGYVLDRFYGLTEGLCCWIHEQTAYSEEEYDIIIPWWEIDEWVVRESNKQLTVSEAFEKIRQGYSKFKGY